MTGRIRQDAQDWQLNSAEHILPLRRQAQPHLCHAPLQLDVLAKGTIRGVSGPGGAVEQPRPF